MRKLSIIRLVILAFFFNSCLTMDYSFSGKKKWDYDLYTHNSGLCDIIRADGSTYYSKQDTFRYLIEIYYCKEPTFVLNSFKLTDKKNKPISAKYYMKTKVDTVGIRVMPSEKNFMCEEFEIDTLPIILQNSDSYKIYGTSITIWAKTYAQIKDLRVVKVEYNFQIGNQQYISDKIIYKRRFRIHIEGHEWSGLFSILK